MNGDNLLQMIEVRASEIGISLASLSEKVVGNHYLISNWKRGRGPSPRIEDFAKIANILGLEFYFGPQRDVTPRGFAEEAVAAFEHLGASKAVTDVFKKGYLPIPWHPMARQKRPAPLALSLAWLQDQGHEPDKLRFVEIDDHPQGPSLLLVDESTRFEFGVATWCWTEGDAIYFEWSIRDPGGPFTIFPHADTKRPVRMDPKQAAELRFLGKVIWSSRFEPDTD